ncbi:hypothetical protein [Kineosporia sp. NBRC 101731]|uniref:hypothetical protein n=1 Tax=Kineosporia sp. NBRC 101731 TaxID=3032199 RepID=UPI0024A26C27|nr:hypothetical protein [Kineosporia sp. NBRC 101731]GLY32113.1 hypothetical protein Kisp02_54780 [Kineosporia sp. NBRC 101731]
MTQEELQDALLGLFAYDTGSRDSGIHDEALRQRVIGQLSGDERGEHELIARRPISRVIRESFLTEEALDQGYGIEDVHGFLCWLSSEMGFDL